MMGRQAKNLRASDPSLETDLTCRFCGHSFKRDTSYHKHSCKKKKRFLQRDEKFFKVAFGIFKRAMVLTGSLKKVFTIDDFIKSTFYEDLVKLAKFVIDNNVVLPEVYVDYLIKGRVPIANWSNNSVYEEYVRNVNAAETPYDALQRNLMLMEQWGMKMGEDWRDFFRKVPPTLATLWLRSGKLSPWMLFLAPSSSQLIERMSEEQLDIVNSVMNTSYWSRRALKFEKDCAEIRAVLESEGL